MPFILLQSSLKLLSSKPMLYSSVCGYCDPGLLGKKTTNMDDF